MTVKERKGNPSNPSNKYANTPNMPVLNSANMKLLISKDNLPPPPPGPPERTVPKVNIPTQMPIQKPIIPVIK